MALSFIDDWLGCLDPKMASAVWNVAFELVVAPSPVISPDGVFEVYTPDDYTLRPAEMMAMLFSFSLTIIPQVEDPELPFGLAVGNYGNWLASAVYISSFSPDLSDAPCTQQTFGLP